ncbi:chaperone, dnaj-like protein, partial [Truncatella angustata]
MLEDYYALLGIPRSANDAAIRSSYRRLALLTHPDKNRGNPTATRRFQQVAVAYETLKDPSKRKVYD